MKFYRKKIQGIKSKYSNHIFIIESKELVPLGQLESIKAGNLSISTHHMAVMI